MKTALQTFKYIGIVIYCTILGSITFGLDILHFIIGFILPGIGVLLLITEISKAYFSARFLCGKKKKRNPAAAKMIELKI